MEWNESRLSLAATTCSKGYPRVLVIIPAFNEQECILDTVASIKAAGYDYVVINDGSQDGTLELCREHGVNILDLPQNLGIGGAVKRAISMLRDLAMILTFRLTAMASMILLMFLSL